MKTFSKYLEDKEGLASLGDQGLSDFDEESPENENLDDMSIVKQAMKIALKSGDKYKQKIYGFLRRLSRDIPELQNIVSQLGNDVENDNSTPSIENKGELEPTVSTPESDSSPEPDYEQGD